MHSTKTCRRVAGVVCLAWLLAGGGPSAQENDGVAALRPPAPTYPGAVAHLRAGRPADALRALESDAANTARGSAPPLEHTVLRAALLAAVGRPAEAESAWQEVMARAVFMRTFARRAIVESAAGRGAPAEAERRLTELTRSDPARHRDLVLRVADAYLTAGRPGRSAALYRQVLATTTASAPADAARLGLAAALEAAGDAGLALATLRAAQLGHRTVDAFVTARREARRLAGARGETPAPFSEAEYRGLVRRLRGASRFGPALALLDEWAAAFPRPASQERIAAERIETLYAQRDNDAAVAACAAFYDRFPASPLEPAIRLTDFRLAVRMGDTARAPAWHPPLGRTRPGRHGRAATRRRRAARGGSCRDRRRRGRPGPLSGPLRNRTFAGRPARDSVAGRRRGGAQRAVRARVDQPPRADRTATGRQPRAGGAVLARRRPRAAR